MAVLTSGMRSSKGSVHAGAATSIWQLGRSFFSVLNRLCANTISPTQAGPSTRILSVLDAVATGVLGGELLRHFCDDFGGATALHQRNKFYFASPRFHFFAADDLIFGVVVAFNDDVGLECVN